MLQCAKSGNKGVKNSKGSSTICTHKSANYYQFKRWLAAHFAGRCRLCLVFMGLDPDSDPSFSDAQSNPLNFIQPPTSQHFQDKASSTTPQAPTPSAPQADTPSITSEFPMSAATKAHFQSIGTRIHFLLPTQKQEG
ncbi:alphaK I8 [Puccinia sorghi]|uniref:AlphaK I8 n=1 Tax=Puccinia sorghi TaxID=27349 RepID=A0A0L6UEM0_9BASI|nr:alphaK I8 [Puccinia sorghi]